LNQSVSKSNILNKDSEEKSENIQTNPSAIKNDGRQNGQMQPIH